MTNVWIGLADKDARQEVGRALEAYDSQARLSFANSAQELRRWAQEASPNAGVVVGPTHGGISDVNVAAAVARDGSAPIVLLVSKNPDDMLRARAQAAGIDQVLEAVMVPEDVADDLEEPPLPFDGMPTMVVGASMSSRMRAIRAVPQVDAAPVLESDLAHDAEQDGAGAEEHVQKGVGTDVSARRLAMRRIERSDDMGPVIALVSGRGGVGKTSIVATMACAAASWGMSVALCDLDLSFGNLYSCFGQTGPVDLAQLCEGEGVITTERVMACGAEVAERIRLWGSCDRPEMAELVMPKVESLLSVLSKSHDLVLVDTSAAFNDAVAQVVQQCDRMIIVVDDRPGTSAAQARLGSLAVRLGVARTRIARLANRCGPRGRGEPQINRAEVGLETARALRVMDGGPEVAACMAEGNASELFALDSRFAESASLSLAQLLAELGCLPDEPAAKRLLNRHETRSRWSFGRRKEAV